MRSTAWWRFQWPWRTPNPVVKVTAFLRSIISKTVHFRVNQWCSQDSDQQDQDQDSEFQDQEQDQDSMFQDQDQDQDQDFVVQDQDQDQDQDSGSRLKLNDKDVLIKKIKK